MLDRPAPKFNRSWLDEATFRSLAHWAMILHLDPELSERGDRLIDWAERCGVEVREMEDGGCVMKPVGSSAFYFLKPEQLIQADQELTLAYGGGST